MGYDLSGVPADAGLAAPGLGNGKSARRRAVLQGSGDCSMVRALSVLLGPGPLSGVAGGAAGDKTPQRPAYPRGVYSPSGDCAKLGHIECMTVLRLDSTTPPKVTSHCPIFVLWAEPNMLSLHSTVWSPAACPVPHRLAATMSHRAATSIHRGHHRGHSCCHLNARSAMD